MIATIAVSKKITAYIKMSRMSNLPTVWANGVAGMVLSGGSWHPGGWVILLAALSAYYVGGMFLNDACDAESDAKMRRERPIPSGLVSRKEAYRAGFFLLVIANLLLAFAAGLGGTPPAYSAVPGAILTVLIVCYNYFHKNLLSPFVMASCRFMVYPVAAGLLIFPCRAAVLIAALVLASYVVGLSFVARQETLARLQNTWPLLFLAAPLVYVGRQVWPLSGVTALAVVFTAWLCHSLTVLSKEHKVPLAVAHLIAGIALWDALLITSCIGFGSLTIFALAAFVVTVVAQRFIAGT